MLVGSNGPAVDENSPPVNYVNLYTYTYICIHKAAVSKVMYNDSLLFNDKVSKSFWYITSHSCCVKKF